MLSASVRCPVLGSCVLLVAGLFVSSGAQAEEAPSPPTLTLDLILPTHALPSLTARIMREEAVRIWAREGIAITWRTSEDQVPLGGRFVRVTLIDDEGQPRRQQGRDMLGDFVPEEGRIRISLLTATRTAAAGAAAYRRPREVYEYPLALGYVLGRAVAHELGHALLGTSHSESGLMAAAFPPVAMTDRRSPRFRLNERDEARLSNSFAAARLARRDAESENDIAAALANMAPALAR